ncbi:flagellar hook-basal body protein [Shouchella clausii]|jgi:flagellar basal-body rod protein FlgF|uniref:Flagellar basal-body rod protein n=3 Tax=Shouchella TaxID=2893057 RepID=Q5WB89_SHOC1|nr:MULTISPECIES: flagellar hook-basal body protein [Shouchella]MCM3311177.1 flagellar hook-basal body protein [Psychrobacillus sp. MER TA 17]ALA53188.1 Flagellar basal-body rod protein FlgF [Shouchella clausii]MBU3231269.1 flagellar hook-basal body protein [Shouchella clausii]MBU3263727.1 flagellar hook-basal body protein [Shouchella clausii]MBU3508119.1 flagellar hook-basal body protein [Shouchella clausii]
MLKGLYTATSGMLAAQYHQDMLANNLANAQTPGYKAEQSVSRAFPTFLMEAQSVSKAGTVQKQGLGSLATAVYLQEQQTNARQGDIQETGNTTDLALLQTGLEENNAVFFAVMTENGIRYTRNGDLQVDSQGRLATAGGHLLQSTEGGPIQVDSEAFSVDESGAVVVAGENRGTIEIVLADDTNELEREGDGLYMLENGELPSAHGNPDIDFSIRQAAIERSNVDTAASMNAMLSAYRLFEANQKVVQAYDQSMDKAVNEVGRLT